MCMAIASQSLEAWLESQERMMRAWLSEAALDPSADAAQLERLEQHCRWLAAERAEVERSALTQRAAAGCG